MKKLLFTTTALLFACVNANADTLLGAYQVNALIQFSHTDQNGVGSYNSWPLYDVGSINQAMGNSTVNIAPSPALRVSGSVVSPGDALLIQAILTYQFQIVGPSSGFYLVPVRITGAGSAAAIANDAGVATAATALSISGAPVSIDQVYQSNSFGSWSVDQTDYLITDTVYTVELEVSGTASGGGWGYQNGSGSFSAFADPTFTLGPGYENYSLIFSDGIGNGPLPVPGPIVGAGLPGLIGLGLVWLARRRQKIA